MTKNPSLSTAPLNSDYIHTVRRLAIETADFLVQRRDNENKPISEGMVYAALGLMFASKARDVAEMEEISRNVTTAIFHAFRMKPPK